MKRIIFFLFTILAIVLFGGCTDETGPEGFIELSAGQDDLMEVNPDGGSPYLRFSSLLDWYIEAEGDASWIQLSQTEGTPGNARVKMDIGKNETSARRSVVLNICSHGTVVPVTIGQGVYASTFELQETQAEISTLGGIIPVRIKSDVEYSIETDADWIHLQKTKAPITYEHRFDITPNPMPEKRSAEIRFISADKTLVFNLTQRANGTEHDDWKYETFVQRSLAMRFTADWCGYCPDMAKAFDVAELSMAGKLLVATVHGEESALEFAEGSSLMDRFYISGFPLGVVDARALIKNYSQLSYISDLVKSVAEETWASYPAKTGIAFNSTLAGSELTVDLDLYVKEADEYKVTVLLLEDNIVGYQNGASYNYQHNDIVRLALTSVLGDPFTIEQDGTIWHGLYTAAIPSACNPENLRVLVYVEKPYGSQTIVKEVESASYGRYGDTYIDNCRTAAVGTAASLELI